MGRNKLGHDCDMIRGKRRKCMHLPGQRYCGKKTKTGSDITPDAGGHRPQRPCAQRISLGTDMASAVLL